MCSPLAHKLDSFLDMRLNVCPKTTKPSNTDVLVSRYSGGNHVDFSNNEGSVVPRTKRWANGGRWSGWSRCKIENSTIEVRVEMHHERKAF